MVALTATVDSTVTLVDDAKYNAFPGLVRCANGDLLAGWRAADAHTTGGRLWMRRSADNGATWQPAYQPDSSVNNFGTCSLSLLGDGRVALASWRDSVPQVPVARFSTDHGATFGPNATISHGLTSQAILECPIVEHPNGTLFAPIWGYSAPEPSNRGSVKVLRSTDGGATFADAKLLGHGPSDGRWYNETGLAVLPNGRMFAYIREQTGTGFRFQSWSFDAGRTWTKVRPLHSTRLFSGAAKGVWLRRHRLWMAVLRGVSDQANSTMLVATRDGHHWPYAGPVQSGSEMLYGQVCELPDGRLGVVHAVGPVTGTDANIMFSTVTLESA